MADHDPGRGVAEVRAAAMRAAASDPGFAAHEPVMGTVASVHVHDDTDRTVIGAAVRAVFAELRRVESVFSTFRPESEISRIGRGELHLLDASAEVIDVLDACSWLDHASGGAFRARRPDGRLDPAGFVKGWAAERAAQHLTAAGLEHWYVSVGGDLQAHGGQRSGAPWRVALADPRVDGEILGALDLVDGAVATSGTAARGEHLWDGRSESPPRAFLAVTVTGPRLTWADAFATVAFVLGEEGPGWVARFPDYHAIAVRPDGTIVRSAAPRAGGDGSDGTVGPAHVLPL